MFRFRLGGGRLWILVVRRFLGKVFGENVVFSGGV